MPEICEQSGYPADVNLDNCAREPIHIIGKTQAHGVLLVCDPLNLEVTQVGSNTEKHFSVAPRELLGKHLSLLISEVELKTFKAVLDSKDIAVPQEVSINGRKFLMLPHMSGVNLVLDFEPLLEVQDPFFFQKQLSSILNKLKSTQSLSQLCQRAVELTRELFSYDRVMVYKFDEDWNGEVVAEEKNDEMQSWLGLHYPSTDIPAQSRAMFLKHRVRVITNVDYEPVPVVPELSPLTKEPLDLSRSSLRAVSPIHIEYLKNMGVGASLSAAIVVKGKLWGLIACHHTSAKYLDHYQKETCRFLSQMLANEIELQDTTGFIRKTEASEELREKLVGQMQEKNDIIEALSEGPVKFTDLVSCGGGALFFKGKWKFLGATPSEEQVKMLLFHFLQEQDGLYYTRNLSAVFPVGEEYKDVASGILSLRITNNKHIIWFRPEEVQTVYWGGNPHKKAFFNDEKQRISPRKSFEKWSEQVKGKSKDWEDFDISVARKLRENVSHVVLVKQRQEIKNLNAQLLEANEELELFSYGLSHDLRSPVRGTAGLLQILEEDYSSGMSKEALDLLTKSRKMMRRMNVLIDDILTYSRLNHDKEARSEKIELQPLLKEVMEFSDIEENYPNTRIEIQKDLPACKGDRSMWFQVWANLITNACKYSAENEKPVVKIGTERRDGKEVFFVRDYGIGFDPKFADKIFTTFKRVAGSKYEGSGIGLAVVKRILEKYDGNIWAESTPGQGATFYFYVPKMKENE